MVFKNLNFKSIYADATNFALTDNDTYVEAYIEFIEYFKRIKRIEKHHLIISSHFVYGWMPTMLKLKTNELEGVLSYLNMSKLGEPLDIEKLEVLKSSINNSVVGVSKLLHFINPEDYAIWDSRIFRYLTEKKSDYGISKIENYLEYLKGIKEISKHENYSKLHNIVAEKFKYDIHPTRAIEIVMFETDRKRQLKK